MFCAQKTNLWITEGGARLSPQTPQVSKVLIKGWFEFVFPSIFIQYQFASKVLDKWFFDRTIFFQGHDHFPRTWSVGLINVEHDRTWWRQPSRPLASSPQPSCGLSWLSCLLSCFSWTFKLSKDPDENMITIVLEQPTCWSSLPTT